MAKGVWNGGNASEAIDAATNARSKETAEYIGSWGLWTGLPAAVSAAIFLTLESFIDEGGLDTINDAVGALAYAGVGAGLGYPVWRLARSIHLHGQTRGIGNVSTGVRS